MRPRAWRRKVLPPLPEGQEGRLPRTPNPGLSWGEAARVAAVCWLVAGVAYAGFAAVDAQGLSVAPLLSLGLAQWFLSLHRDWTAGAAAAVAGAATLFGLVDTLRPDLGHYVADALATGFATTAAVAVVVLVGRIRRIRRIGIGIGIGNGNGGHGGRLRGRARERRA